MHTHGVNIAAIRKDYQLAALDEQSVGDDPLLFFGKWLAEAEAAQIGEVNAMTIATVDAQSKPHARIVLLKGLDESGFVFFYKLPKCQRPAAGGSSLCHLGLFLEGAGKAGAHRWPDRKTLRPRE